MQPLLLKLIDVCIFLWNKVQNVLSIVKNWRGGPVFYKAGRSAILLSVIMPYW